MTVASRRRFRGFQFPPTHRIIQGLNMKTREELKQIIDQIAKPDSPVGMDALYVHAVIVDRLNEICARLDRLESAEGEPARADE